ncbi:unnamed protein product [Dibothriocephalus latus]|uniref:Uncharacterized protein n=1 Tax=Dibothriocephalus latus TaxID=60516 RepID=A0A3P7M1D3_DIBLA|nr:unnamed protein product [Dibothriocephalus latus]
MQVRHLYDNSTTTQMTERTAFSFLRESLKSPSHRPPVSSYTPRSPASNGARSPCHLPTTRPDDVSLLKWFQISLSAYISANLCPPLPDLSAASWRCANSLLSEHFSLPLPAGLLESSPVVGNCSNHLENQSDPPAWSAYLLALYLRLSTLSPSEDYASLFVCRFFSLSCVCSTFFR